MKIGFIGAGKVGKALGLYFRDHNQIISGYYSRTLESTQEAALLTKSKKFATLKGLSDASDIVFITVPDHALKAVDGEISALLKEHCLKQKITWVHVSGAHASAYLTEIKSAGGFVGSMHPLQSFGEPISSASRLNQAWFTIEGTDKAICSLKTILAQLGAKYSLIEEKDKPLYHAGACVVSNFLVTLLENGIRFFEAAGMSRDDIFQAIEPLIEATLANIREKGTINALTGPIVRGDYNTVNVHLDAIGNEIPNELDFYKFMALQTVMMLKNKRLTKEQTEYFQQILEEETHV